MPRVGIGPALPDRDELDVEIARFHGNAPVKSGALLTHSLSRQILFQSASRYWFALALRMI